MLQVIHFGKILYIIYHISNLLNRGICQMEEI